MTRINSKRILIFIGGYFPGIKFGGPSVSIFNLANLLKNVNFTVVTLNHDYNDTKRYFNGSYNKVTQDNQTIIYLDNNEFNIKTFRLIINDIKPDLIYLQSIFHISSIYAFFANKKFKIPLLISPRGELCKGAIKIKKFKKILFLNSIRLLGFLNHAYFHSTSEEETQTIKEMFGIKPERIFNISNVPTLPDIKKNIRKKNSGSANIIFLSRIHPKKNLLYAIQCLKYVNGYIEFDIYGPIEDIRYWEICLNEIENLPSNIKVKYKGIIDRNNINSIFKKYDVFLFPTLSENFGHVIAESLAAGTPVITSNQTPWNDFYDPEIGYSLALNNKKKFIEAINFYVNARKINSDKVISYFTNKMNIDDLEKKYTDMFNYIIV